MVGPLKSGPAINCPSGETMRASAAHQHGFRIVALDCVVVGWAVAARQVLASRQHEAASLRARRAAWSIPRYRGRRRSARNRFARPWRTSPCAAAACSFPSRSPRRACPIGVSSTVSVEPSPKPQISRSIAVGISLRCLPSSAPSGAEKQHRAVERAASPSPSRRSTRCVCEALRAAAPRRRHSVRFPSYDGAVVVAAERLAPLRAA